MIRRYNSAVCDIETEDNWNWQMNTMETLKIFKIETHALLKNRVEICNTTISIVKLSKVTINNFYYNNEDCVLLRERHSRK
jgi:hypothetical protein